MYPNNIARRDMAMLGIVGYHRNTDQSFDSSNCLPSMQVPENLHSPQTHTLTQKGLEIPHEMEGSFKLKNLKK